MKILLLNYEYPPLGGGAANATAYLLQEYAGTPDLLVDVVTSAPDDWYGVEKLSENITVYFVPIGDKRKALHHQTSLDIIRYAWRGYREGARLMQINTYDATHAFFGVPCGAMALLLKWRFGVPYIVSLRGSDVPGYSARFRFLYPLLRPLIRLVWSRAGRVIANSRGLRELAQETSSLQEIDVIPNGVDTKIFHPNFDVRPSNECIVTSGATRITARKGIKFLVEAVVSLHQEFPRLALEILGDGSEKENLVTLVRSANAEKYIRFLGRVAREETNKYYQRASIFVLPSANEGMSNALLEALASGLPALVTRTGGSEELVTEGANGMYIEKESSKSIAQGLRTLLEAPTLCFQLGEESQRRAETQSWQRVAGEYQTVYTEIQSS
jgi:glycosyltransferase involved in cell wall biosynthesis